MPDQKSEADKLHQTLKTFYNANEDYFLNAGEVNADLTPERRYLFACIKENDRVLDVGCGPCDNQRHLKRSWYVGCDISQVALRLARNANLEPLGGLVQGESQRLPFRDNSFDAVLSTYALEHFVFPRETMDEMWRVARPGGKVILISPAYDHPLHLPSSTSHWSRMDRGRLIALQAWRQLLRHFNSDRYYFARVQRPRVLADGYQSDFDAVHLVSAREVANFWRRKGGNICFERKRVARSPSENAPSSLREKVRNFALRFHIGEYAGLNLQIVVEKPARA
jgi:SAM-dependent methyltransferase